ncbi:hypothetical protein HGRIS_001946 [Hohenbuehelia grisea]|uniref:Uncharacterized protein n=1 Tax=Hohenbuehelia grisea TaxID=104357 RepID=A0ABR3JIY1_9AGAR
MIAAYELPHKGARLTVRHGGDARDGDLKCKATRVISDQLMGSAPLARNDRAANGWVDAATSGRGEIKP